MKDDSLAYNDPVNFIQELKAGREAAFNFLFRSRYKKLCRFAWTFLNDYTSAEDIVQDLFSRIWRKKEAIAEGQSIDSYLYVSVRNACFTYLRTKKQKVELSTLKDEVVDHETDRVIESPVFTILWKAVEALPLQCKVIFKLVVLEDMKYQEVAEYMGISINSVKTQMKIAYKELRAKLDRRQMLLLFFLYKCFNKQ